MRKLNIILFLLTITFVVMAVEAVSGAGTTQAVAYDSFVKTAITDYTGTYKLEKANPYLIVGNTKHLLLLAPPEAMDSLGLKLADGDTLFVQAAVTKEALLVTTLKWGEKLYTIRSQDLKYNHYDEASTVKVTPSKCIGCKLCVSNCPVGAITMVNGKAFIDDTKCVSCGICIEGNGKFKGCPVRANNK